MQLLDPTTGKAQPAVPWQPHSDVMQTLQQAQSAYGAWRNQSFAQRGAVLRAVAAALRDEREQHAHLMTAEMGKPLREARGEVDKAAWCAEHYAEHAAAYLAEEVIASDAERSSVRYLPLGTVLGILPWNAPYWLAARCFAPALMAGNSVVLKNDALVPRCGRAIAELFARVAPPGLLQCLYLDNASTEALIDDERIAALSFTGSTRGGSAVARRAAANIKPAVLELGGSDPALVLADADIDKAVQALVTSRMINAGQSCIAAKRILVEADIFEPFVEQYEARLRQLKLGDPADETTDIGPLARADLRDNLHRQVRESIAAGAHCRLGGELPAGPGFFYPPTLLTRVPETAPAYCEETFGPVAVINPIADVEQGIALANATPYGLAASLWTMADRGVALAARLEAGQVAVNGIVKTDPRLPSGGIKRSGYGRELGPHGIRQFVNAQQLWLGR